MKFTKLCLFLASIGALVVSSHGGAVAATSTSTFNVQTTVNKNCTIKTVDILFGDYDPLTGAAVDTSAGSVSITCTKGATTTIGLDFGKHETPSGQANMSDGATPTENLLMYTLYKDAPGGAVWGNSGSALFTPVVAPSKAERSYPIFGRITSSQDVPPGTYKDIVTATVNF